MKSIITLRLLAFILSATPHCLANPVKEAPQDDDPPPQAYTMRTFTVDKCSGTPARTINGNEFHDTGCHTFEDTEVIVSFNSSYGGAVTMYTDKNCTVSTGKVGPLNFQECKALSQAGAATKLVSYKFEPQYEG